MVVSYRTDMTPMLQDMAKKLAHGFQVSRQGCFLWVAGAILREFSEDRDLVDAAVTEYIYSFFEAQSTSVLRVMNDVPPNELPDVIEDFFRLLIDALLYYPHTLVPSALLTPIFEAAIFALTLEQRDPLSATLHYLRDLLGYAKNEAFALTIKQLLASHGETLVKRVMAGMMITFPRDCFADGSGVLLALFEIFPAQTTGWVDRTIHMLPEGTVTPVEAGRLMLKIKERLQVADPGGLRQVRALLQDFTNTYRRRYVAPRDGLGGLEATRFRFEG